MLSFLFTVILSSNQVLASGGIEIYSTEAKASPQTVPQAAVDQHLPSSTLNETNLQNLKSNSKSVQKHNQKRATASFNESGLSNLPQYYSNAIERKTEIKTAVILPTDTKQEKLLLVRPGDTAKIQILHSIIAFPDESAPVVATVQSGPLSSARLYGEARLEQNSQRIFVEFIRVSFAGSTYEIKGKAFTRYSGPGFIGEYHSQEGMFFTGDFLSTFVAAYFDAQVPRTTNAFGQVVDDRSVDAATKKAMAAGAMSSADRFKQKLQKVPAFSELKGPIEAEIIISETGQRL